MKKNIVNNNVFYSIEWSAYYPYERLTAGRILPEMPGILNFVEKDSGVINHIFLLAAWRDGLRDGVRNLFDSTFTRLPSIRNDLFDRDLFFRYSIIDTSPADMQDILFWLLKNYRPLLNNNDTFEDSKRYSEICVEEKAVR